MLWFVATSAHHQSACPPKIRTHRYPTSGDVHDEGSKNREERGGKVVGSAKTQITYAACTRAGHRGRVGLRGRGGGERDGGNCQNRPTKDGHRVPALLLAVRRLLLPHFDNRRVGGRVNNFFSPPLTSSKTHIMISLFFFHNPNSCRPRALYPAVDSDHNRRLRACAKCPAAYWPTNNCEIPYNPYIHGCWYFSHRPCHSTPTLGKTLLRITSSLVTHEHHFLGTEFSVCLCTQSPQHGLPPSSLRCL